MGLRRNKTRKVKDTVETDPPRQRKTEEACSLKTARAVKTEAAQTAALSTTVVVSVLSNVSQSSGDELG